MKAYKATHNFKCLNQQYKVGKTYTADKMEICVYGIHFCPKMEDVLNYYEPIKGFILLEIEVLGDIKFKKDKGVTDKMKVLRVVPPEEYSENMKKRFPVYEYDSNGNMITETYPNGDVYQYEYDSNGNKISVTYPNGIVTRWEYDLNGNKISESYPNGDVYRWEYDLNGNKISESYPNGVVFRYEYDLNRNMISETRPNGDVYRYEYDSNGNMISEKRPNGNYRLWKYDSNGNKISEIDIEGIVHRFRVATITESDS